MIGDEFSRVDGAVGNDLPRYCPRCQRDARPGDDLCANCGERFAGQSYCPICERFWKRAAGADCPKHDLPLEPGPPVSQPIDPAWGPVASWQTVGTFADPVAAEAPRIRLEAEGIPTFLEGERMGGRSMYQVATGGVKLQVPRSLASDARVLLSQSWSLPKADDDLDDAWEELGPEPGAGRRSVMKGVLLVLLFGPLILFLIAWLLGQEFQIVPRRMQGGE